MKIVLCGGGTGGHITPLLSIAHEIKRQNPHCRIVYVGEHGAKFADLTKNVTSIDEVKTIYAGKFRRYYGESWFERLKDYKTFRLNVRDFFYVIIGIVQSYFWLGSAKPNVVFLKGGYVSLPLGLAAKFRGIPFITHDSDSTASLANRIVGKWAVYNATGMPSDLYNYPMRKMRFVGIPVSKEYEPVNEKTKLEFRKAINVPAKAKVLLITGGSLGAVKLNKVFVAVAEQLIKNFPDLYIFHQVGKGNTDLYGYIKPSLRDRVQVHEFIPDMYKYSGAADIVLTRGGATSIAELAVQEKPTIIVPNPILTGGQQTKNAEQVQLHHAAIVLDEANLTNHPNFLLEAITKLLKDEDEQKKLSDNIKQEARPDASAEIANLILSLVKR